MVKINKVGLIGRLTVDPTLKYTAGAGIAVTTLTLAIDRRGSKEKETDFIQVVIWGKTAEATAQYVSKGLQLAVWGRIQTRSFENKEGKKVYVTEVVAEEVQFLEKKRDSGGYDSNGYSDMEPVDDGEIPF